MPLQKSEQVYSNIFKTIGSRGYCIMAQSKLVYVTVAFTLI
jgi:hypothetical protein